MMKSQSGFSLLELLAVMFIMALAVGFIAPKIKNKDSVVFKTQVRKVVAALNYARRIAVINGRPQEITVQQLLPDGDPKHQLEELSWVSYGSDVTMSHQRDSSPNGKQTAEGQGEQESIIFFPDGGNTGGKILLKGGGKQVYIVINPVTGRVEIEYVAGR